MLVRRHVVVVLSGLLVLGLLAPAAGAAPDTVRVLLTFEDSRAPDVAAVGLAQRFGGSVAYVYEHALNGAAIDVPATAVAGLARAPGVTFAELDGAVTTTSTVTQSSPTWGLNRIDQRDLPLDSVYEYVGTGSGVRAYIVDTGIRASHTDVEGRVVAGATAISDGRGTDDCNGHGTHVAGTVGGTVYGVAKAVTLVPVRVLDCQGSGSWSGVIAGLDWIAGQEPKEAGAAVANMSLGGGANSSVDAAVQRVIDKGVTVVVAAGNSNRNACNYSPARAPNAVTVGATTSTDARASYSNFGSCLDLFAPGSSITSAWHTGDTVTNTISGTSMAAPHVAGVAALLLADSDLTAARAEQLLIGESTPDKVTSAGSGSPNRLLYARVGVNSVVSGGGSVAAPVATFTPSCSDLTCTFDASASTGASSYSWTFGDGSTGSGVAPSRTYAAGGTYTVTLTATGAGGSNETTRTVTVSAPQPIVGIQLTVNAYVTSRGAKRADLSWVGNGTTRFDVYRNSTRVVSGTTATSWTDTKVGSLTSVTYRVCPAGASTSDNRCDSKVATW
jgi:subtilisin family serine protease